MNPHANGQVMDEREHVCAEVASRGADSSMAVVNPFPPSPADLDELVAAAWRQDPKMRRELARTGGEKAAAFVAFERLVPAGVRDALSRAGWGWRNDPEGRLWIERSMLTRRIQLCLVPRRGADPEHWAVRAVLPDRVVEDCCPSVALTHFVLIAVGRCNAVETYRPAPPEAVSGSGRGCPP